MSTHMSREIEKLKKKILSLSAVVEESFRDAVRAVSEKNAKLATRVIKTDVEVDQLEVDVEEECLKMLALYQPVATDLRFIVAVLKINNDLERIGDLAVNIAEQALFLATQGEIEIPFDLPLMTEKTQSMLRRALDALVGLDKELAYSVCAADDEVDAIHAQVYTAVHDRIRKDPSLAELMIHLLSVSRHLERIADYATNIAEDVIYLVEGEIIRHKAEHFKSHGGAKTA